jgi:hypothetical protein
VKARLYIETTIPSYLVARPSRDLRMAAYPQTTTEWWDQKRNLYDLFISDVVLREIRRGERAMAEARLNAVEGLRVLAANDLAARITRVLLSEQIIPHIATDDAAHVGVAAAHGMEFLLTWNCRHINNPAILRRIETACEQLGVGCPVICTPSELMDLYP